MLLPHKHCDNLNFEFERSQSPSESLHIIVGKKSQSNHIYSSMYGEEQTRRPVVLQPPDAGDSWGGSRSVNLDIEGSTARNRFREFFRNFRMDNVYIYRDALIRHWNRKELFVEVELAHLNQFDEVLFNNLQVWSNLLGFEFVTSDHQYFHEIDTSQRSHGIL